MSKTTSTTVLKSGAVGSVSLYPHTRAKAVPVGESALLPSHCGGEGGAEGAKPAFNEQNLVILLKLQRHGFTAELIVYFYVFSVTSSY